MLQSLKGLVKERANSDCSVIDRFVKISDVNIIKQKLLNCEKQLRKNNYTSLKTVTIYGQYLNCLKKTHFGRFKSIVKETLEITPRWAHTLCNISVEVQKYVKIQSVYISISNLSSLLKHIKEAIEENPEEESYWKSCQDVRSPASSDVYS